jgi:hypothetical protein
MVFMDKSDRMVNSYGIARKTWKWTKKLFFLFLDMAILNAYLLHKSCGEKITHKKFPEILVRDLIVQTHKAISRSVAFLKGGQVHLGPNQVD